MEIFIPVICFFAFLGCVGVVLLSSLVMIIKYKAVGYVLENLVAMSSAVTVGLSIAVSLILNLLPVLSPDTSAVLASTSVLFLCRILLLSAGITVASTTLYAMYRLVQSLRANESVAATAPAPQA